MTTVGSTTSTSTASTNGTQATGNPNGVLGKDDFLKLFVTQMQHQDPMSPMDDSAMVAQMASLSTVEQLTNLSATNAQMAYALNSSNAVGLIGRTVSWTDDAKQEHSGVVEKVTTKDGTTSLTVGGTAGVDPSTITQVA